MKERRTWLPKEIARRCVFCGGQPARKNREHILPQWLLELTGDPSRVATVAFDWQALKPIAFSWNSFTAPACIACNTTFADLEAAAKSIVLLLLEGKPLSGNRMDVLLRWLDKVRVGLWLISNVLGGGPLSVAPTFAIRDRMDTADRSVVVVRTCGPKTGLTVIGSSVPLFLFMPSCFGLVINGLALINISTQGLLRGSAGFPWLDVRGVIGNGQLDVAVNTAVEEAQVPLVDVTPVASFVRADKTQPILSQWGLLPTWGHIDNFLTDWCRERLLKPGLSRPLVCLGGVANYLSLDETTSVIGDLVREPREVSRVVVETQLELVRRLPTRPRVFDVAIKLTEKLLGELLDD